MPTDANGSIKTFIIVWYLGSAKNIADKIEFLDKLRDLADEMRVSLKNNDISHFGELLHEGWVSKKILAKGITNTVIDKYYNKAIKAGATGGKISGAGGGGFLTLYCEKHKQEQVRDALRMLQEMEIKLEPYGSRIIFSEL